jgi:Bacterial membrane protein YfhO
VRIKSDHLAALAVALAPLLYFLPGVLGRVVLAPDDGLLFNVPLRVAAARITLGGSPPLWNPYIFCGMPLHASAQGGLLFPLNWFYLAFPTIAATNLMVVSTYVLAGLGAYLFARRSGESIAGSLVTAASWQTGGFLVAQLAHINIAQVAAMTPWVFWALEGYSRGGGRRRGALLSLLVALQAFVGHQQTLAYSLMLVGAYAVVMALSDRGARSLYLKSLAFVAAGLPLAAVQILPTFELLRNSLRAEATYEFFTSFSLPRRFALTFFAPYVMGGGDGRLFRAPYVGPPFYAELVGYVGLLGLMLALAALMLRRDARTLFWAAAAAVCFMLALGGYAPLGVYKLVYHLPVLNLFRVPARHLLEVEFALAILAGRGVTALQSARGTGRALRVATLSGATVFVLTCLAVTALRPEEFRLGRVAEFGLMRAPELFVPVVLAAASAWALWAFARGRGRRSEVTLVCVLVFDLVVWGQSSGWRVGSPVSGSELWASEPEVVKTLRSIAPRDASSYRILTAPHTFDPSVPPVPPSVSHSQDWVVWTQPDLYMEHGIQNAGGYDGFGLARYSRLAGDMKVWGELTDPDRTLRGPSREIDVLNVRYLLSMRRQKGAGESGEAAPPSKPLPQATTRLGDFTFAEGDLGLPNLGAGKRLSFTAPNVEAERVALVTNLSWSEAVPEGVAVARVRLRSTDGREFSFDLRAGSDTAEWAHDRPDIRTRIRHARPPVATSYAVADAQGSYEGHTYLTSLALPERVSLSGGEITIEPSPKWPDLQLGVYRVSLVDEARGVTYALTRERVSVEAAPTAKGASTSDGDSAAGDGASAANVDSSKGARRADERWKLVAQTAYVNVYENAHALPRAWLAADARALGEEDTLSIIRAGAFADGSAWEPTRTALVESEVQGLGAGGGAAAGRAEVTRYEPNRVDVKTDASAPSVLVLAENHYPGWRAYVDGGGADVLRVDYNLRGVVVPAGAHEVSFVYRPKSVLVGLAVTLLTAAALALFALAPVKKIGGE